MQISSNAKLVKWADGTYGVYLGNEYYDIPGEMLNNQLVMTASGLGLTLLGTLSVWSFWFHRPKKRPRPVAATPPAEA